MLLSIRTGRVRVAALAAALLFSGCASDGPAANNASEFTYRINLPPPSKAELGAPRSTPQSQPYLGGVVRTLSAEQRRVSLARLRWGPLRSTSYIASIAIHSPGAKSLRVGVRLSSNLPGVQIAFRDANKTVAVTSAAALYSATGPYWAPVIEGDTAWIEIRATAPIQDGTILEIPSLSHLP